MVRFKRLVVLAICCFATYGAYAEENTPMPSWQELTSMIGTATNSAAFKAFAKKYSPKEVYDRDGISYTSENYEFSIIPKDGKVVEVWIQDSYPNALPHSLKIGMSSAEIKKALGEPDHSDSTPSGKLKEFLYKEKDLAVFMTDDKLDTLHKGLSASEKAKCK